jgi:hypothetical protein
MAVYTTSTLRNRLWLYSILVATVLTSLEAFASFMSRRLAWVLERAEAIGGAELEGIALEPLMVEELTLEAPIRRSVEVEKSWRNLTTNLYVTLVLYCAASGLVFLLLPHPAYFHLLIAAFPFVSAYFLARSWLVEES